MLRIWRLSQPSDIKKKTETEKSMTFFGHIREFRSQGNCHLKAEETGEQRIIVQICLWGTEATRSINSQKHLNDNFDKLLEAQYILM